MMATAPLVESIAQQPAESGPLLREIVMGQRDPVSYHDFILSHREEILPLLKNSPRFNPSLETDGFLASLNLDWGNYGEAAFFAQKALQAAETNSTYLRILCAARYGRGDREVIVDLKPHYPKVGELPMYADFEKFLKSDVPLLEKRKWLRKQCSLGGSSAFMFLNALLSHPDYSPPRLELDAVVEEITSFFKFWSGLEIREVDEGGKIDSTPSDQYIFDPVGRYFNMSLISLDLAAQFRRLGLEDQAKVWILRSKKSYGMAQQTKDLEKAWSNRYYLTNVRLKVAELESLVPKPGD